MLICLTHYHAYVANHSFYKIAPDLFKMPLIQLITIWFGAMDLSYQNNELPQYQDIADITKKTANLG